MKEEKIRVLEEVGRIYRNKYWHPWEGWASDKAEYTHHKLTEMIREIEGLDKRTDPASYLFT